MTDNYINYAEIMGVALRQVIRNVLSQVARDGIQGEHNFFITFFTNNKDVKLSERMKVKYPQEITIQLQHQFSELRVDEEFFSVRLSFGGISEVVAVPYKAVTMFDDRGGNFALEFNMHDINLSSETTEEKVPSKTVAAEKETIKNNVILLDKFRKK